MKLQKKKTKQNNNNKIVDQLVMKINYIKKHTNNPNETNIHIKEVNGFQLFDNI